MNRISAIAVAGLFGLAAGSAQADDSMQASASFIDRDGNDVGTATLVEGPNGVVIDLDLKGLPEGRRAIHIHRFGTCEDPDEGFVASGGHLNPEGKQHGLMNPDGPDNGDLPNIIVLADGTVQVELFTNLASLHGAGDRAAMLDEDGAAFVIHQNRDDHITQPIGG
ncbi:MAG: superoxide dismutase family protein, partial [Xanthomonadaceae bacterium]|nr:superoxide dismutase family protein [Xanthomonadaceae bacterium]